MKTRNSGFTIVETLIVVLLGAVVMATIYKMVIIQEKTTREQFSIVQTAENAQMALAVLASDLKEISARDSDVVAADSTSITFRALRKAGIVCTKGLFNDYAYVWELGGPFVAEDSVLIFADGANTASSIDDRWNRLRVSSVVAGVACPANPLGLTTRRLNFAAGALANIQEGALVRSFNPATRYRLADNGTWGELRRTEAGTETPLIEQLATVAEGGLRMRYFDSAGVAIPVANLSTRRFDIMRIQIKVRGKGVSAATSTGSNRYSDSLITQVYLRGNSRGQ